MTDENQTRVCYRWHIGMELLDPQRGGAICMTDVLLSPDMTKDEFQAWYDRLKAIDPTLTHAKLAERLDVDQPRIGKWLRGEVKISGYLHLALERLEQLMIEEHRPKKRRRQAGATDASSM